MEWREQSAVSCDEAYLEAQRWIEVSGEGGKTRLFLHLCAKKSVTFAFFCLMITLTNQGACVLAWISSGLHVLHSCLTAARLSLGVKLRYILLKKSPL